MQVHPAPHPAVGAAHLARGAPAAPRARLAVGVVYEINHPLATIAACAESLGRRIEEGAFNDSPETEDLREYLGLIRDEAFRCKTITNGLLDFSRLRSGYRVLVNVEDLINIRIIKASREPTF